MFDCTDVGCKDICKSLLQVKKNIPFCWMWNWVPKKDINENLKLFSKSFERLRNSLWQATKYTLRPQWYEDCLIWRFNASKHRVTCSTASAQTLFGLLMQLFPRVSVEGGQLQWKYILFTNFTVNIQPCVLFSSFHLLSLYVVLQYFRMKITLFKDTFSIFFSELKT